MSDSRPFPLMAVDVGNSRVKLGLFTDHPGSGELPQPDQVFEFDPRRERFDRLEQWLANAKTDVGQFHWWIGSVQREVSSRLVDWLRDRADGKIRMLASGDLPIEVALDRPDMVGIDRLLGAVAANQLRRADHPAVVVDLGTAITVDLISAEGVFLGGAILPGIGMSARAMHEFTDLLPLLDMTSLAEPPAALGTSTVEAMTSGIYWGAVGGVRELLTRLPSFLPNNSGERCDVILTGGAAPSVAGLLSDEARYEPHLVLAGVALAASGDDGR